MKFFPHLALLFSILLAGCTSIPEPTLINIGEYIPQKDFPLDEFSVPLSSKKDWDSEGWQESSENETAVWTSTSGTATSLSSHQDAQIHLEMQLSPGSSLEIKLQNAYPLVIHADASAEGHGSISGISPSHATGKKPGLWQSLDIEFSAPTSNDSDQLPARIIRASLNGIPIHQQVLLPASNAEGFGGLVLQATGEVSLRNIAIKRMDQVATGKSQIAQKLIPAKSISYEYFEKADWNLLSVFDGLTAISTGSSDLMDIAAHSQRESNYGLIYTGTFTVPAAGTYVFLLSSDDGSSLTLDGELSIMNDGFHGDETVTDTIDLEAGEHEAVIHFFQGGGGASLRLDYTGEGLGTIPLFSPEKGAVSESNKTYLLDPESEPIVQRGFLIYPPNQKLALGDAPARITHGVSVGDPAGNNFAVDAGQGTLLMLWHGKFANMANMWEGRGEWQNLSPLGDLVARSGKPDFAFLPDNKSFWPDSLGESSPIQPKGYELDDQGWPTFEYKMGNATIEDGYLTNQDGLIRTTKISGNEASIYQLIASGTVIENLGKGSYAVQGPGYLLHIKACKGCELFLRKTAAGQELVASIKPGGGGMTTAFSW